MRSMPNVEPPGEIPSVSDSQGIQVGSSNTQYNSWVPRSPLDPAALAALNPHTAVVRLQRLSHDELADFFARAQPVDVGEIIEVFAEVNLPKLVAALGDINRRKVYELIAVVSNEHFRAVLGDLPEAVDAIARKAAKAGWVSAEPLEAFLEGYARKYSGGHLFWSEPFGVTRATGAIDSYWAENGYDLGCPVEDKEAMLISPFGTTGFRQRFQPGTVYSSARGVFRMVDDMCYQNEGGSGGWLGFPVSERQRDEQFGEHQMFEGGAIYSYVVEGPEGLKSFAVSRKVLALFPSDPKWRPVSKEASVVSALGTPGTVQHFETKSKSEPDKTAVYISAKHSGPLKIDPKIWDYYSKLGAEKSWLGFPVEEVRRHIGGVSQDFEAGDISYVGMMRYTASGEWEQCYTSIDASPLDPNRRLDPSGDLQRIIDQMDKPRRD